MATDRRSSRRVSRTRGSRLTGLFLEALEERRLLATDYWTSATSGSWNNPQDWSTGAVPQAGDAVVIDVANADPTVTFNSGASGAYLSVTVKDTLEVSGSDLSTDSAQISGTLVLDGGQISLASTSGAINLAGTTNWSAGTLSGPGNIVNTGTINLPSGSRVVLDDNATLVNEGQLNVVGLLGLGDQYGSGAVTNKAGGTIDFLGTGNIGGGTLTNLGTIANTAAGTGTIASTVTLNNQGGTFKVTAGTLLIEAMGTSTAATFTVSPGAQVDLEGTSSWTGTLTGSGGGMVVINSSEFTADGATFNFPTGMLSWVGGEITGTFTNKGDLTIAPQSTYADHIRDTLNNTGTVELNGLLIISDTDTGSGGGFLNNSAGGTITLVGTSGIAGETFNEAGTLDKTGSGTATIQTSTFNNTSLPINVSAGSLVFTAGGNSTGVTFTVATGAQVDLEGSSTWTGTTTGSGGGTVVISSSEFSADGATFNFPTGMLSWVNGEITGTFTNKGDLTIAPQSTYSDHIRDTLNNTGTMELDGLLIIGNYDTGSGGAFLNNSAGGTITLVGTSGIAGATFNESGTLDKTGSGTATIDCTAFNNLQAPINVSDGSLTLESGGTSTGATFTVASGSEVDLTGQSNWTGNYTGSGGGQVVLEPGTYSVLNLNGATLNFPAGILQWPTGELSGNFTNLSPILMQGTGSVRIQGTLTNKGTLDDEGLADFYLGDNSGAGSIINEAGAKLILNGTNLTIGGNGSPIQNAGEIDFGQNLWVYDASVITNTGTITVGAGSTLLMSSADSNRTLATGTYEVGAGASLQFANLSSITTNKASITLDGAGALVTGLNSLASNSGTLEVADGGSLKIAGNLQNTGTVVLGAGGTLNVPGTFTQTAAGTITAQFGVFNGSPAVGLLNVTGKAQLGGTFAISIPDGVGSIGSQTLPVLGYASETGSFATLSGLTIGSTKVFQLNVNPTQTTISIVAPPSDLATTTVTGPTGSLAVGASVTVNYTVKNEGQNPALGPWTDSVYLAPGGVLSSSAILLGRTVHSGNLAVGASDNGSLSTVIPVAVGAYEFVVVTDSGQTTTDVNRTNNQHASTGSLTVTVPSLAIGGSTSGTLAAGQDMLYAVTVPVSTSVVLTLNAPAGSAAILARAGGLPTDSTFDAYDLSTTSSQETVTVGGGQGGTVYVMIEPQASLSSGSSFTLSATAQSFAATAVSPTQTSTGTSFTVLISGSQFTPKTTVSLKSGSTTITPTQVYYQDSSAILATFPAIASAGSFQVVVTDSGKTSTLANAFQLSASISLDPNATNNAVVLTLSAPTIVRAGSLETLTLTYTNTASYPVPAPLLDISSGSAALAIAGSDDYIEHDLMLLAIDQSGPAGILPAGYTGQFTISARPDDSAIHTTDSFQASVLDDYELAQTDTGEFDLCVSDAAVSATAAAALSATAAAVAVGNTVGEQPVSIDWATVAQGSEPAGLSTAAWNLIISNLEARVGTDCSQLQAALDADATYLSTLGEHDASFEDLIGFELDRAEGFGALSTAETLGSLGYGQFTYADLTVASASNGYAIVMQDGQPIFFAEQADGSYLSPPGVYSTLAMVNGAFQLTESDGTVVTFNADGTFHSETNPDGTSLVAGYSSGHLTTLTDNLGQVTTYTWNSHGTIAKEVDPNGETTTYDYNSTGLYLTSVIDPLGTTQYKYSQVGSITLLTSVTDATYVTTNYSYNAEGMLVGTNVGGQDSVTLSYPANSPGEVDVTDASGATTQYLYDISGSIVAMIDPSGNMARATLDASDNITAFTYADGTVATATYDSSGDLLSMVDPLGNRSSFTYDPTFHQLTSYTDANGYTTTYTVNAQGETTGTTYADGTTDSTAYNSQGQVTSTTGRDGQTTTVTYASSSNDITGIAHGDGTQVTYTYDAHHNILTATNGQGTTTFTYNAANEITSVTYPTGLSLTYTYDAAGRETSMTDQAGYTQNYVYNRLGELSEVTDASGHVLVSYAYDNVGRVSTQTNDNETSTTYTYDADGEVTKLVNLGPGGVILSSFVYTYDVNGYPLTMTTLQGTTTYQYDADGRLIAADMPGGETLTYSYDGDGNITSVTDSGKTTTSTVNNVDELTSSGPTTYHYNADGYLTSMTKSAGTTTYSYDASGNLIQVVSPTAGTYQYLYDAMGTCIATIHNGVHTNELFNPTEAYGDALVGQFSGTTTVDLYVYGVGLAEQVDASGNVNAYGFDAQGNTSVLTGSSGAVLNQYTYSPYGALTSSSGTAANPFTFCGQNGVISDGSGLYFMRNREYDPASGRFTQPDPTGLAGGLNSYEYAGDAPTVFDDPTGLQTGARAPSSPQGGSLPFGANASRHAQGIEELIDNDPSQNSYENYIVDKTSGQAGMAASAHGVNQELGDVAKDTSPLQGVDPSSTTTILTLPFTFYYEAKNIRNLGIHARRKASSIIPPWPQFRFPWSPKMPKKRGNSKDASTRKAQPGDPNDISGPTGYGTQGFVNPSNVLPYAVLFENEPTASAAAAVVTVTETLSPNLDWSTFQLGTIQIGALMISVPAGLSSYHTQFDETSTMGVIVDVAAALDLKTGVVTWTLTALDPATLDVPSNPVLGLLPPDDSTGQGEGYVSYTIQAKQGLATGTTIAASASVVFDTNAAIATPTITNTIDASAPATTVKALPAQSPPQLTVSWSGTDTAKGSGVGSYSLYVSVNGGPMTLVEANTTSTSATVTTTVGDTYGFAVVATSNVGISAAVPTSPQVSTTIVNPKVTMTVGTPASVNMGAVFSQAGSVADGMTDSFTGTVNYGDGTGVSQLSIAANDTFTLSHVYSQPGIYSETIIATDSYGVQAVKSFSVTVLPVSGLGAGKDAFVITLYRELLGTIPTKAQLISYAKKLKTNAAYSQVGQSIYKSAAYKALQKAHKGTGISYAKAYKDAITARNLLTPPAPPKKK